MVAKYASGASARALENGCLRFEILEECGHQWDHH
jgi:hypothetical protein